MKSTVKKEDFAGPSGLLPQHAILSQLGGELPWMF